MVSPDFDPVAEAERIITEDRPDDIPRKITIDSKSAFHLARNLEMLLSIANTDEEARVRLALNEDLLQICIKKFQEQDLEDLSKETVEINFSEREVVHIGHSVAFALQYLPLFYGANEFLAGAFLTLNKASVKVGGKDNIDLRTKIEMRLNGEGVLE